MDKLMMIMMFGITLISLASAEAVIAGNNFTFSVDTTEDLIWGVINNQSNMEGFEVYQEVYDNYSNITFVTDHKMKSDSFTITLTDNSTKEIIKEVRSGGGGGGGGRTIYIDKNVTQYVNNTIEVQKEIEIIKEIEDTDKIKGLEKIINYQNALIVLLLIMIITRTLFLILKSIKNKKKPYVKKT